MDVGDPSNFVRILDLYGNSVEAIRKDVKGFRYSDQQISETLKQVYEQCGYLLDPHGACGYRALEEYLTDGQVGIFLETAHPAKFTETVESIIGKGNVELPEKLAAFMKGKKQSLEMTKEFDDFKTYLMSK
jgi:threonine synthase